MAKISLYSELYLPSAFLRGTKMKGSFFSPKLMALDSWELNMNLLSLSI